MRDWREVDPDVLQQLCDLLKPFKDATVIMRTESSASISLIRPLLHQLMAHCRERSTSTGSTPGIHETCEKIRNNLETRYIISFISFIIDNKTNISAMF